MPNMLIFDMDGTVADLYGVPNWLPKLRSFDPSPYQEAKPLVDMERLREAVSALQDIGWESRIVSWLSKDSPDFYKELVREAKRKWLEQYCFPVDKVHFVQYGTTKANCVRDALDGGVAVLFDDTAKVRQGWHLGEAIDPQTQDIIEVLKRLRREAEYK